MYTKKNKEITQALEWWIWVLSDKGRVAALKADIQDIGDFYANALLILSGKEGEKKEVWPRIIDKGPRY